MECSNNLIPNTLTSHFTLNSEYLIKLRHRESFFSAIFHEYDRCFLIPESLRKPAKTSFLFICLSQLTGIRWACQQNFFRPVRIMSTV